MFCLFVCLCVCAFLLSCLLKCRVHCVNLVMATTSMGTVGVGGGYPDTLAG